MDEPRRRIDALKSCVRQIPFGRVASYGLIGRMMPSPVSGLLIGRWLYGLERDPEEDEVPWWRVVKADGGIALFRRDAALGMEQVRRLQDEGVVFTEDRRVDMRASAWEPSA